MKNISLICVSALALLIAGCSSIKEEKETYKEGEANIKKPVNCSTAEGDIRALESEKAYAGEMIGAGVLAVVPISLIEGVVARTEGKRIKIATGDYNKKLKEKIAQIKETCNIQ
jgi:hypothetical protein